MALDDASVLVYAPSQFVHLNAFSLRPNKAGQSIDQILGEAERLQKFSGHVLEPAPPNLVYGVPIPELRRRHLEILKGAATLVRKRNGEVVYRAIRKDRCTLAGAVVSWPILRDIVDRDDQERARYERWKELNLLWLQALWGDKLQTVLEHEDENYLHLHAYALPTDREDCDAKRSCLPPWRLKLEIVDEGEMELRLGRSSRSRIEILKAANREYREEGRRIQDHYFESVGAPAGLMRTGPRRRRVSRAQWHAQASASRQACDVLLEERIARVQSLETQEADQTSALEDLQRRSTRALLEAAQAQAQAQEAIACAQEARQEQAEAEARRAEAARMQGELELWIDHVWTAAERLPQALSEGRLDPDALLDLPEALSVQERIPFARLRSALEAMADQAARLGERERRLREREAEVAEREEQGRLLTMALERAAEALPQTSESAAALDALRPPEPMQEPGRSILLHLQKGAEVLSQERRKLNAERDALRRQEAGWREAEKAMERALGLFRTNFLPLTGSRTFDEAADRSGFSPEGWDRLAAEAPQGCVTRGFALRFEALHDKDGQDLPCPPPLRTALDRLFGEAGFWGERRRLQEEALEKREAEAERLRLEALSHLGRLQNVARNLPNLLRMEEEALERFRQHLEAEDRELIGGFLSQLSWSIDACVRAVREAEAAPRTRLRIVEALAERLPELLEAGAEELPEAVFGDPEEWDAEGRALTVRLRKAARSILATRARLEAQESALRAGEKALEAARKTAEDQQDWISRALGNLGLALSQIVQGTADQLIAAERLKDRPKQFEVLKTAAPEGRPTLGFWTRFWSLNRPDSGDPYPYPQKIGAALKAAFDRVEAWGREVHAHRIAEKELEEDRQRIEALRRQTALRLQAAEALAERLPELLEAGAEELPEAVFGDPEEWDAEGRVLTFRLRKAARNILAAPQEARARLEAQESALRTGERALETARKTAEDQQAWIAYALKNLGVLLNRILKGTADQILTAEAMKDRPKEFEVLKTAALGGEPTLGFRARFWSFHFSDSGAPYPYPQKIGSALGAAFDRVEAWGREVKAHREAEKKLQEAQTVLQAAEQERERKDAVLEERRLAQSWRGRLQERVQTAQELLLEGGLDSPAKTTPALRPALQDFAQARPLTEGLRLRFEALHDNRGQPLPLPEAFTREVVASFDELERLDGLRTAQRKDLERRQTEVGDREARLETRLERGLGPDERFYEQGFADLSKAVKGALQPEQVELVRAGYRTLTKARLEAEQEPPSHRQYWDAGPGGPG